MDTGSWLRALKVTLPFWCVLTMTLCAPQTAQGETPGGMQQYCSLPPLPGLGVKPNLLLMIDNSSSMYDLAYTDLSSYCIDNSFDPAAVYLGYFDRSSLYAYSFTKDGNGKEVGRFVLASGTSIATSSCNQARTGDVCVNVSSGTVDGVLATGNFLNWLGMSKLDIEKMALTGGKYDPASGLLEAETRGCQGKRFVKMAGDQAVTFAVRGPLADESDYVKQSSYGGGTRIDIYIGRYNQEQCSAAIAAWQDSSSDPVSEKVAALTAAVGGCMGNEWEALFPTIPTKGKVFNEIMSICYTYLGNEMNLPLIDTATLRQYCSRRYQLYSGDAAKIVQNTGDDVCGKNLFHNTNLPGSNSVGYLGGCYQGAGRYNTACALMETRDYCATIQNPWLIDPAGADANLPGFVLDAGITNMGAVAGTLRLRFAPPAEPEGLIQLFASDINFGAMTFNENGAGTECGGAIPCIKHCQNDTPPRRECTTDSDCNNSPCSDALTKTDGGRVVAHLNSTPLGDHTPGSGLVAAIDAIRGTSWTPLSEGLYQAVGYFSNRSSLKLQAADFDETLPPSRYSCQGNHLLIVTDGMSTADRAPAVTGFVASAVRDWVAGTKEMPASLTTAPGAAAADSPPYQGSYNLDDLAWIARNKNIFDPARPIALQRDYISTHVVYTGVPCGDPKSTSTPKAGYNADGTCTTGDEGVPEKMMQLTAAKGSGSFNRVQDQAGLQEALKGVFMQVKRGTNAGTGASILSTGQGNGALFLQAQYYPSRSFDGGTTSAAWIGEMRSLWYFIDPFISSTGGASTIREDTEGGRTLDLKQDRVVQFARDPLSGESVAKLYVDANGDGNPDFPQPSGYPATVAPEEVQSLWRAGFNLWRRDAAKRTIYTQTGGSSLVPFLDGTRESNRQLLRAKDQAEADRIISFVKGSEPAKDDPPTRNRSIGADGSGDKKVWKLGDIISSEPVQQSSVPLGSYHLPPPAGYADGSYAGFVKSTDYGKRGTVYVGANDGMLHAFKLGTLKLRPDPLESWPAGQKAALLGDDLGEEQWAFIPKGALPYLRYLKEPLYPHLYYVDGSSTLVDASLGDPGQCSRAGYWECAKTDRSWRTVLVGGMGLGGASRGAGVTCVNEKGETTCVNAPPGEGGGGLSSYFALDVTEQGGSTGTPSLLWEFSHPELGFATSGVAILKIKARSGDDLAIHDPAKNGRWFAVFASGPTGPIDTAARQFLAWSDQELKLFVVDLNAAPPLTKGVNYWVIRTGIKDAFGGQIAGGGIDTDKRDVGEMMEGQYEDDALYVGYTRRADDGVSWTGGVLRLFTREDPDPSRWEASPVIDGIGPVTGGVAKLQDRNHMRLWLYFGTGRFFHNRDDLGAGRAIFGVSEPCYTQDNRILRDERQPCAATPLSLEDLTDVSDDSVTIPDAVLGDPSYKGWRIALDPAAGSLTSERTTVAPSALTAGAVIFTTYKPPVDACLEGVSYLWGVKYDTGGAASSLNGKALLQLSNGSSSDLMLTGFADRGKRRSPAMAGKAEKPRLITNSGLRPLKKIIHIQER